MNKLLIAIPVTLLLAGCELPDEDKRLSEQGLPPSDFLAIPSEGQGLYQNNCSQCHGREMQGVDLKGPPLLHSYYEPGHHSDYAFYSAIKSGVKAHHWKFGDMPPQPQVDPKQAAHIVAFVRKHQQRAGIK